MPNEPSTILAQIDRATRENDLALAAQLAHRALEEGHLSPDLLRLRAQWRRQNGQLDGALEDLQQAHALLPNDPAILTAIAEVLNTLGRHRLAITAAGDALQVDGAHPTAWFQKAFAHQMVNEFDLARDAYLQAVRCKPDFGEAHARLANLSVLQGRTDEARQFADRALAYRPGDAGAMTALVRADLTDGRLDAAEGRLVAMLSDSRAPPTLRAGLLSLLGDLRDAQGCIDLAFDAYTEAGAIWRSIHEERFRRSGRETAIDQIVRVTSDINRLPPGTWRATGSPAGTDAGKSNGLVFVLGFPRSGTTLLGQILANRPGIVVLEEKPLLAKAVADLFDPIDCVARLAALSGAEIASYREDFWRRAERHGGDLSSKLVIEQTAFNTAYLPVILRLFPDAKIVFALRDPRDVVLSCFRRQFAVNLFTLELNSLESTALLYDAALRLAEVCRALLGLQTFDIRNEDVIADFDSQTRRLCEFVGSPWDESMRDFHRGNTDRTLSTVSASQVRRGLSANGVGHWRSYRECLGSVLPVLMPWVERFGYPAN